jgi:hypothetical protein
VRENNETHTWDSSGVMEWKDEEKEPSTDDVLPQVYDKIW